MVILDYMFGIRRVKTKLLDIEELKLHKEHITDALLKAEQGEHIYTYDSCLNSEIRVTTNDGSSIDHSGLVRTHLLDVEVFIDNKFFSLVRVFKSSHDSYSIKRYSG